jgi:hypothetical protein
MEELDLSQEPAPLATPPAPHTVPYNPEPARERMRGAIVIFLLAILGGTVAASFVALWVDAITAEDLRTLLTLIFTPIIGLVGAATGFYYGGRTGGTQG